MPLTVATVHAPWPFPPGPQARFRSSLIDAVRQGATDHLVLTDIYAAGEEWSARSYMPDPESDGGRSAARNIDAIFERFARDDCRVAVRYRCVAFVGRPLVP